MATGEEEGVGEKAVRAIWAAFSKPSVKRIIPGAS
jgi:hypothetical protein